MNGRSNCFIGSKESGYTEKKKWHCNKLDRKTRFGEREGRGRGLGCSMYSFGSQPPPQVHHTFVRLVFFFITISGKLFLRLTVLLFGL
jgi:hypothetical protein